MDISVGNSAPFISVLIPSYKRPECLKRCLKGLSRQSKGGFEIMLVIRKDDVATFKILQDTVSYNFVLRYCYVDKPGYLNALIAGSKECRGEIISFFDDDAEPAEDWLDKMITHFQGRKDVGAVGGRIFNVFENGYTNAKYFEPTDKISHITVLGRSLSKMHDIPIRPVVQEVDFLPGSNLSFRRQFIDSFDPFLATSTMTPHFETDFCWQIRKDGYKVIFDSTIVVYHYPAKREGESYQRKNRIKYANDIGFTFTYVMMKNLPFFRKIIFLVYNFLIGQRVSPGLLTFPIGFFRKEWFPKLRASLQGKIIGLTTYVNRLRGLKSV